MVEKGDNTEKKILEAAEDIFVKKGLDGARMQEIADKAGINKALVHYYYRTKEKLFETVFKATFTLFVPHIKKAVDEENDLFVIIKIFVNGYIDLLSKNQFIPGFIISELRRNPDWVIKIFRDTIGSDKVNVLEKLDVIVTKHIEQGKIRPIETIHLLVNIISLCIFPIIAKPLIAGILANDLKYDYSKFLKERKEVVSSFIINSIKI